MITLWPHRKFAQDASIGLPRRNGQDEQPPTSASRPVAFMHIPKTSGTALMSGLAGSCEPSAVVKGFDLCLFGSFREFDTLDASEQQRIYASSASLPAECELITGHFALSTLRQAYPCAQIMTVLREPFSRLLSHWLFWRQHTEPMLAPLGKWADFVRYSRQPLTSFLSNPLLACQTDNLALRMLLWPHPLIPADQFIKPIHHERLIKEATAKLCSLEFVDVLENGNFVGNLERWIGRILSYERENETIAIPTEFRAPLHRELTAEAYELLRARSHLDLQLWAIIARRRMLDCDVTELRERTILANVARYGALMAS